MITDDNFWQVDGRKPAWHRIQGGIVVPGEYPSETLVKMGEYHVERAPLAAWSEQAQAWMPVDSHFAILRQPIPSDPTYQTLGVVSADYTIVQHAELARSLDSLVRAGWQLETAAILHNGAQLFMTFCSEGYVVNGDDITSYWGASVRHAASALNVFNTPVRMVCENTFKMGLSAATEKISIPHYSTVKQELEWATEVLAKSRTQEQAMVEELTAFGQTPMDPESYTEVLDAAYRLPTPPRRMRAIAQRVQDTGGTYDALEADTLAEYTRLQESYEAKRQLMQRLRDAVSERVVVFNQDRPQFANTAWSVWNSLSEVESHRKGKNPGYQILFGERGESMARAYRELVKVAAVR